MPFFVVGPAPFPRSGAGVRGPFASQAEAETARRAEGPDAPAALRIIEAADQEQAEALARQAFSPSPDA